MKLDTILRKYNACEDALVWANGTDPEKAWDECQRGDWLLWIAARAGVDRKKVVMAACKCARLALKYATDPRVKACIETVERWAKGKATIEEVREARAAAAAYAAAADAAYAAAYAADAAAAYAAAYAADAAAYAADAAAYAANDAARRKALNQCAKIARTQITFAEVWEAHKKGQPK